MRSNWGGDTKVICNIGTIEIARTKTKQHNRYLLQEELGETELQFDAIKAEVPEEVRRALNMNEINLQMQLDRPFLLADSPGEVGAHFNRIAHLDVIDIGTQNVQKWIRSLEQDIRSGEQYLQEQEEELKKYGHLDKLEQEVEVLEILEQHRNSLGQRIRELTELLKEIDKVESAIEQSSVLLKGEQAVVETLKLYEEKHRQEEKINRLSRHITAMKDVDELWQMKRKQLKELEEEFDREFPDICPLCGKPK
jgi:hypothetical protein